MFNFKKLVSVFVCLTLLLFIFTSCNQGLQGLQGEQGPQGEDGITPVIEISSDGYWIINNEKTNIKAIGVDGTNGIGITNVEVVQGNLIITYSNGTIVDLGSILPQTEGTEGLDYYQLPDGTYGVSMGRTRYLEEIVIPATYNGKAVTQILENAFKNAKNIQKITIPDGIKIINDCAFQECSALTGIAIGNNVTSIGSFAFEGCSALTSIAIGNNVTSIESNAFYGCSNLVSITIPDSVTQIGASAFRNCSRLESIILGSGISNLSCLAFAHCDSLSYIYYNGTISDWNKITIEDERSGPNILPLISYYSSTSPTTSGNYWRYVNGEPTPW